MRRKQSKSVDFICFPTICVDSMDKFNQLARKFTIKKSTKISRQPMWKRKQIEKKNVDFHLFVFLQVVQLDSTRTSEQRIWKWWRCRSSKSKQIDVCRFAVEHDQMKFVGFFFVFFFFLRFSEPQLSLWTFVHFITLFSNVICQVKLFANVFIFNQTRQKQKKRSFSSLWFVVGLFLFFFSRWRSFV